MTKSKAKYLFIYGCHCLFKALSRFAEDQFFETNFESRLEFLFRMAFYTASRSVNPSAAGARDLRLIQAATKM